MFANPSDDVIRRILTVPRTIAVVGCSPRPERDSHAIARLLMSRGHRIIPVNPGYAEILGQTCYPDLLSIPEPVSMVDVFRRPQYVAGVAQQAIRIKAEILWTQLDVIDVDAAAAAQAAGLIVVMDRCPAIEYRRLAL